MNQLSRSWNWFSVVFSLGIFMLALWGLHHISHSVHPQDIKTALIAIPHSNIILALILVAISYFLLTFYDLLGIRHTRAKIAYPRVAQASFIAYAFANTLGLPLLSGGSIRYRIYSVAGLSTLQIGNIIIMVSFTFTLGAITALSMVLLLEPQVLTKVVPVSDRLLRGLGAAVLVLLISYVLWMGRCQSPVQLRKWQFNPFSVRTSLTQIGLVMFDLGTVALIIYVLLPADVLTSYHQILGAVVLSLVLGLISNVPGGIGVFEAAMVLILQEVAKEVLLASLLVFRAFYYLLPFLIAIILLLIHEWVAHRSR